MPDERAARAMRDHAVALAELGFRIFKLIVNGKLPAIPNFYNAASAEPDVVRRMWTDPVTGDSLHNNIGILTGNGLMVLDVDVKDGKRGAESLEALVDMGLDTNTREAISPTGSRHFYYQLPPGKEARNTASKLGPGLDTRGHHGYVVAPGSVIAGRAYEWRVETEAVTAPDWLLDLCAKRPGVPNDGKINMPILGILDEPAACARAREWLMNGAPEAIEGSGGNATTYWVAARCKDFGLSESGVFEALLLHWNEHKAIPPWGTDDLEKIVANAYHYGTSLPGSASAHADFEAVDEEQSGNTNSDKKPHEGTGEEKPKRPRIFRRKFDEARARALRVGENPLLKKFLDCGAMSVVYGDSNTGKTFLALDIAYHVAAGLAWNGRQTVQGVAVYVAAEAGEGINARIEALARHYKPSKAPPLDIVPCLVDLFNPKADLKPLIALIGEAAAEYGAPVRFVVIDTLARVIGGGDENSTQDMSALVGALDKIRVATGAHVMVVHHSGKNKAAGARGSGALRAATDTEIEIEGGKMRTRKQREYECGRDVGFTLKAIEIGVDRDGDKVTSCVVELGVSEFAKAPLTPVETAIMDGLLMWEAEEIEKGEENNLPKQFDWKIINRIICSGGCSGLDPNKGLSRVRIANICSALFEKGWISKVEPGQWVIS